LPITDGQFHFISRFVVMYIFSVPLLYVRQIQASA